jgi:hypothetical protein
VVSLGYSFGVFFRFAQYAFIFADKAFRRAAVKGFRFR